MKRQSKIPFFVLGSGSFGGSIGRRLEDCDQLVSKALSTCACEAILNVINGYNAIIRHYGKGGRDVALHQLGLVI